MRGSIGLVDCGCKGQKTISQANVDRHGARSNVESLPKFRGYGIGSFTSAFEILPVESEGIDELVGVGVGVDHPGHLRLSSHAVSQLAIRVIDGITGAFDVFPIA